MILRFKPKSGFSHFFHIGLNASFPILLLILIRISLAPLAAALVLLGKWRMFAVRPRHWPANIRANAVDIIVGISAVVFMTHSLSASWQLLWALLYAAWLVVLKPGSGLGKTSLQALVAQLSGLMALFIAWGDAPLYLLVLSVWVICYSAARHFFTSFEEPYTMLYAQTWGYFGAALAWVLGHWLLFYGLVAQLTMLLTVIGYGLAALYYLDHTDRLSLFLRRQFLIIMVAIVVVVLVLSDWGDKAV